jgi:protein involved in polysaccharide export with SLBB domain
VTAAGGANDRANESKVQVIRRQPDGGKAIFKVNLKRIKRGKDEDLTLERKDIVVVPESFF